MKMSDTSEKGNLSIRVKEESFVPGMKPFKNSIRKIFFPKKILEKNTIFKAFFFMLFLFRIDYEHGELRNRVKVNINII